MLDPSEGYITIDGIDLATIPRNTLRSRLNAIPQEAFFLAGTIRMNLDINGTATEPELIAALKSVQLLKSVEAMGGLDCKLDLGSLLARPETDVLPRTCYPPQVFGCGAG